MSRSADLEALLAAHPSMRLEEVFHHLRSSQPALLTRLDGLVVAINLLGLWLVGGIRQGELTTEDWLGMNTFDMVVRDLWRIPVAENRDFYAVKAVAAKRLASIFGDHLVASFKSAMQDNPELLAIYNQADLETTSRSWTYTLKIIPPDWDRSDLLKFQTSVFSVYDERGKPFGFATEFKPMGITAYIIQKEYHQLTTIFDIMKYVQYYSRGGDVATKERSIARESIDPTPNGHVVESGPQVTLYVNKTEDSQKAFEELARSGISFGVVPSPHRKQLMATFGPDSYKGLAGVRGLIESLHEFESTLVAETKRTMPHLFERADQELIRRTQERREQELEQARGIMSQLQSSPAGDKKPKDSV